MVKNPAFERTVNRDRIGQFAEQEAKRAAEAGRLARAARAKARRGGGTAKDKPADKPAAPAKAKAKAQAKPTAKPSKPKATRSVGETLAAAPKAIDAEAARGLPKAQTAALERYRGNDFFEINQHLRGRGEGKKPAGLDRTVRDMDAAFASSRLTEDVTVHRGISNVNTVFGAAAGKNLAGVEWTDAAPQSTSASEDVADRFQRNEADWGEIRTDARMVVRVPKGVGAVQLSDDRYEAEMLLERGLRMRVVSDTGPLKRGQKGPRTIEVEVVPA